MDPSRFASFEFEQTTINGVTYRVPVLDMNKDVFRNPAHQSKEDFDRYKFADYNYRNKANEQDDEEDGSVPKFLTMVDQDDYDQVDGGNIAESAKADSLSKNSKSFKPGTKIAVKSDKAPRDFTHFVSIPIDEPEMQDKIVDLQYKIDDFDARRSIFEEWWVGPPSFHFTICMLPLDTEEAIEKATKILTDMQPEIQQFLKDKNFTLNLKGVGQFAMPNGQKGSKILWADIAKDDNYYILVDLADLIIKRMLLERILYENELGLIQYDQVSRKYMVKFHLTLLRTDIFKVNGKIIGFNGKYTPSKILLF